MSRKSTMTIDQMQAERRELDRTIRAAQRAEAKAAKEAFLSECHSLGERISRALGVSTLEEVRALRELLQDDDVVTDLQRRLQATTSDTADASSDITATDSSDISEPLAAATPESDDVAGGGHDDLGR